MSRKSAHLWQAENCPTYSELWSLSGNYPFQSNSRIQAASFSFFLFILRLPGAWFIHLMGQTIALQERPLFSTNPRVLFNRLWSEYVKSPCWNFAVTDGVSLRDHPWAVSEKWNDWAKVTYIASHSTNQKLEIFLLTIHSSMKFSGSFNFWVV